MKKLVLSLVGIASLIFGGQAFAHVGYRSLDVNNPFTDSVTSDFGWYEGTQATLGNSHDLRFFSFTLAQDSYVDISVASTGAGDVTRSSSTVAGGSGSVFTSAGDLNVGFSLYSGLLPAAAYENASWDDDADPLTPNVPVYPAAPGNNGLFNALADITMGNNSNQINTITYLAHANDFAAGDTETLNSFFLQAGIYSLVVGGASEPAFDIDGTTLLNGGTYGVVANLSVQPVPVPGAVWLFGSAIAGLIGFGRRKSIAA
jgi:hypothetical protein